MRKRINESLPYLEFKYDDGVSDEFSEFLIKKYNLDSAEEWYDFSRKNQFINKADARMIVKNINKILKNDFYKHDEYDYCLQLAYDEKNCEATICALNDYDELCPVKEEWLDPKQAESVKELLKEYEAYMGITCVEN